MRRKRALLPKHKRILENLGENIRLARLRRKLSAAQVAERAGISRNTLYLLEKGKASTSIATLFQVMMVLGLESDFAKLASDDEFGRKLEDARLLTPKKRAPRKPSNTITKK